MKPLPRTYDAVFEQAAAGSGLPIEFLRAVAFNESGMDPRNKTGNYWGLFQVGPENLADFNAAHGSTVARDELLTPATNAAVWVWEMGRIRKAITGAGVVENWDDRDWVALCIAGWNSGWSEKSGVRYMLDWLKKRGLPLTHDNVFKYGKQAGAVWSLQSGNSKAAAKYRWQRDTAAYFAGDRAAAGDPEILANLQHWTTKRITLKDLTPPSKSSSGGAVASTATPLPRPEESQGRVSGDGAGVVVLLILLAAAASK